MVDGLGEAAIPLTASNHVVGTYPDMKTSLQLSQPSLSPAGLC